MLCFKTGKNVETKPTTKETPKTIANFKKLVSEKFYDGLIFHRVIKGFMIQGGDPLGTGVGGSKDRTKGIKPKHKVSLLIIEEAQEIIQTAGVKKPRGRKKKTE